MILIDNLSGSAFPQSYISMPDGSQGQLNLYYAAASERWFFDFIHPDLPSGQIQGLGLCIYPNLLRQWINFIDFGMSCTTQTGSDPMLSTDFQSGNASIYILDASDVTAVEIGYFGNILAAL